MPKQAKFFVQNAIKATSPFTLANCGSIDVTNVKSDGVKHFFKVTKRIVLNSNFIIIEDMVKAPYKIDNLCQDLFIGYSQVGACHSPEDHQTCPPNESRPFAWNDVLTNEFLLHVHFYMMSEESQGEEEPFIPEKA